MALNIRDPETERLAERVARLTGETKTTAVTKALRQRLERLEREREGRRLADRLDEIALHSASLPALGGIRGFFLLVVHEARSIYEITQGETDRAYFRLFCW
jgi:antitoxin VapB